MIDTRPASETDRAAETAPGLTVRLEGIHARRPEYAAHPDRVWEILGEGSRRAREAARATMDEVRAALKIDYRLHD